MQVVTRRTPSYHNVACRPHLAVADHSRVWRRWRHAAAAAPGRPGQQRVWCVHPAGRGRLLTAGVDGVVRLWDTAAARCLVQMVGHVMPTWPHGPAAVNSLDVHGQVMVSGSSDHKVKVRARPTGATCPAGCFICFTRRRAVWAPLALLHAC